MAIEDICPEQRDMDVLLKVMDFIIPADDFPSASGAGVSTFLVNLWSSGAEPSAARVFEGLRKLERDAQTAFGAAFVDARTEQREELILRVVRAPWFVVLCELVAEGYYCNPGNGSNPDAISWQMIGYEPGLPEGPDDAPPNRQEMVRGKLCA